MTAILDDASMSLEAGISPALVFQVAGLLSGRGGYRPHAEEHPQQRNAQGDEHYKERPDCVQSENDDAYECVREAVRLEPGVEHEVWEAKIRNSVEAHDDEGCLPNVV